VWRIRAKAALIFAALLAAGASYADPLTTPTVPWALGDWGGIRTQLFERGIDFQFGYANELATNTQGGVRRWAGYTDQVQVGSTLNLERLFGIQNAIFQISYTERSGRNLVTDAQLNTLQLVQEVWGRGQTTRLTQFWYDQHYLDNVIALKVGRMNVGGDFAAFTCDFQNLTFCGANIGNVAGGYIYNWPIAQWAARLKINISGFGYIQAGAYDQNQQYLGYTWATLPVFYENSQGVMYPVEVGWLPNFGGSLPGSYKVGAWYSTAHADDVALDINGTPQKLTNLPFRRDKGLYGYYINFLQQLTRNGSSNPQGGLRMFLNAVATDQQTQLLDRQIALGIAYLGLGDWRPNDEIAFAVGANHANSRLAESQMLLNDLGKGPVAVQRTEYVMEWYYGVAAATGVIFRPNLPYLITPGGTGLNKNAVVVGMKTLFSF
jgi:porin